MARGTRRAARVERLGPKPDNEIVRELEQAKSTNARLRTLQEYGSARYSEGYDEGFRDGEGNVG